MSILDNLAKKEEREEGRLFSRKPSSTPPKPKEVYIHLRGPDFKSKRGKMFFTTLCGIRSLTFDLGSKNRFGTPSNCDKCTAVKEAQNKKSVEEEYPTKERL